MRSKLFIYVALASDIGIAVTKFLAASFTGSSAMVSEGIHSLIDSLNQILLLWGIHKSRKKPSELRPFGYGKELYFWSFVVSLMIFTLGGCISCYEGMSRFKRPASQESPMWNYVVLAAAFVMTAISLVSAFRVFNKQRGELGFWEAIRESKDPSIFIVLLGDLGDLIGLVIAFLGVLLGHLLHNPYYDGAASILIGVMMILISLVLVKESRSLLLGEAIHRSTIRAISALIRKDPAIVRLKKHFSMYLAPDEVVLQLIVVFRPDLTTQQISEAIERTSQAIQEKFPRIRQIFIEPVVK